MGRPQIIVPLVANGTSRGYWAAPAPCTVTGIKASRGAALASAAGSITAAVKEGSGTTLLSTATVDAKALTATPTDQTLTATLSLRSLVEGEVVQVDLVSNNADATGGPLVVQIEYTTP